MSENIMRLAHIWQRRLDEQMRSSVGLTAAQFRALAQIEQEPGIGSAALGRKLLIVPQSAGPLVNGLVHLGYAERDGTARVGIRRGATLTAKGRDVLHKAYTVAAQFRKEDEADITEHESIFITQVLQRLLQKLISAD